MSDYLPPPSSLPPGAIVDAYLRDSGGPRQEASTDQQLNELRAYCARYGLTLRQAYIDVAKSGGSIVAREQFNALIDATRAPENRPAAVLLWNYARFARDLDDAIYYKALLRNREILVHSITDPIPEGQYGRIVEFFIDISNEEKRRQTSSDAKRGLRDLVLTHGCVPGVPPRGFMREKVEIGTRRDGSPRVAHRWVPDPEVVPRIQQAFAMRAGGATLDQIHTTTRLFTGLSSYKALFTNRLYIGVLEFGDLMIENYCAPLIDMPTWNTVQERIQEHSQAKHDRLHPRRANSPYILSGMVFCGECGSPMSANTVTGGQRGRNEAYRCSRSKRKAGCHAGRVGRRSLEQGVLETLREYILQADSLGALYEIEQRSSDHRLTRQREELELRHAEKRKLSTQIANLTRAIAERGHSEALLTRLDELESKRRQHNLQIAELERVHIYQVPQGLTKEQILAFAHIMNAILSGQDAEKARQVLLSFVDKIVVKKDETGSLVGTITYYTPVPAKPPPFDLPLSPETGYNLPTEFPPLGAPRLTHTIEVCIPIYRKPRSR